MIRLIICLLGIVVVGAAFSEGNTGAGIAGIVIVLLLLAMGSAERKDTRAWMNCRDYWAAGGPDRYRRR